MLRPRSRIRALAATLSTLVVGLSLGTVPPSYGVPAGPGEPPRPSPTARPTTVTLLTGDRVTLVPTPSGQPRVVVDADDYAIHHDGDRIEVIPRDVLDLVPDVLDPALFDVAGLAAMGYDDAGSSTIPLIVHRAPGVRTLRADPVLRGQVALPSIRAAAVRLDKERAEAFGDDLVELAARPGAATRSATADALGGIDRIWLDAAVSAARAPQTRAPLAGAAPATTAPSTTAPTTTAPTTTAPALATEVDPYLAQIGAPEAWATGLDGSGVRVAVLDSGIDSGHPALVGRVVAERNFSDSGTVEDVAGHGTHVASLVAGSGAGSDGARQGIAPAAGLLNGKVLGDEGQGQVSWVIAGMEWAVDQGADIVNMSVAARAGLTDDPVVMALDALSRDTGTLFVVAAGNSGWNGWAPESVSSPGTAASALTVGAVDDGDRVAGFSGQGPTTGSYRAKPDVVAPGVAIPGARVGARDGDLYWPMDGTSMATPLVAGAAALVLQEHPGWTWEQVRSAVTTSADPVGDPWSAGAGRLALDRAVDVGTTVVPSNLSPGPALHPRESPLTTTVTLTNTGPGARTYTASDVLVAPADGASGAEPALAVTPATVTVEPGATATLDVAFDPGQVGDGYWHGVVELTADDGTVLRLPFASYDEPERYWLDVSVRDRNGEPYPGAVPLLNLDNGYFYTARPDETGHARLRVAPGTYSAVTVVTTEEPGGTSTTVVGPPALEVRADTALAIDARDARRVRPPVVQGRRTTPTEYSLTWHAVVPDGGPGFGDVIAPPIEEVLAGRVFVAPAAGADETFRAATRWRLEPQGRGTAGAVDAYELVFADDDLPDPAARVLGGRDVRALAEVTERTYAASPRDRVLRGLVSSVPGAFDIVHWRELTAPRTETVAMTASDDVGWAYDSYWLAEGPLRLFEGGPTVLTPGSRVVHHFRRGLHVGIPAGSGNRDPWGIFVEQGLTDGNRGGQVPQELVASATTALYADGELVSRHPAVFGWFDVPAEPTSYRLVGDVRLADGGRTRTQWTFRSELPDPDLGGVALPLLGVDYGPSVGLSGTAARGRNLRFDLRLNHLHGSTARDRIASARLQWSADGGRSWHEASLRRTGGATFGGTVKGTSLRRADTVSVRLRAADVDGNTIDQTVWDLVPVA